MKKLLVPTITMSALIVVTVAYQGPLAGTQSGKPEKSAQREDSASSGKKIFVARCSSCHGEDGSKLLADGSFLIQRLAPKDDLERALSGRLRKFPEEERRAVLDYVRDLVDRFRSSNATPKSNQ